MNMLRRAEHLAILTRDVQATVMHSLQLLKEWPDGLKATEHLDEAFGDLERALSALLTAKGKMETQIAEDNDAEIRE